MAGPSPYLHEDKPASFLDRKLWVRIMSLAANKKGLAFFALGLLLTSEILPLLQPRLLRGLIDGPIKNRHFQDMPPYLLAFAALAVLAGLAGLDTTLPLAAFLAGFAICSHSPDCS